MYVFTVLFVALPILYMFLLSFLQRAQVWGVDFTFTPDNYKRILEPLYLNTFLQSLKLAFTSTLLVALIGYPYGYFMAQMNAVWKRRMLLLIMIPFWTSGLIRLYGWIIVFRSNGVLDKILMGLHLTDQPVKAALHLSGSRSGYGICSVAFYDPGSVFQCGETGSFSGGSLKGPGSILMESVLDSQLPADPAWTFVRSGSFFYPIHGSVLHRGYPGRQ